MSTEREAYALWSSQSSLEPALQEELSRISQDDEQIQDRFYKELAFGTSGLRGVMGAGTNRMNVHVLDRATQGVARYLLERESAPEVAVAYDTRNNSLRFAKRVAEVLAGNGITVHLFRVPCPVSALSYAIRRLKLSLGIMITASHNPKEYNGYKVYGPTGCQIVGEVPDLIYEKIKAQDYFASINREALFTVVESDKQADATGCADKPADFTGSNDNATDSTTGIDQTAFSYGGIDESEVLPTDKLRLIDNELLAEFVNLAAEHSLPGGGEGNLRIVYTPLHGVGAPFVLGALEKAGFLQIEPVASQMIRDGNFPTCPYPNPEKEATLDEAKKTCDSWQGDIILVTDPDSDRMSLAIPTEEGYWHPTGNQIGILLTNYLCENQEDVAGRTLIRTIVTTDYIDKICAAHDVSVRTTLTGFKYIGTVMDDVTDDGADDEQFLLGVEEATGYLGVPYIRDKDGVSACVLAAQMAAFYKMRGMNLKEAIEDLYDTYGYRLDESYSYVFPGAKGQETMQEILAALREDPEEYFPKARYEMKDYLTGVADLPKADVLEFTAEKIKAVIRPSGTEPKIKAYLFVEDDERSIAHARMEALKDTIKSVMGVDPEQ